MYGQPNVRYPTPEERSGKPTLPATGISGTPVAIKGIPDGIQGTEAIVKEMGRLAKLAYSDERVNRLARMITASCPSHDHVCEVVNVFGWFQQTFRYTRLPWHPDGLQRLQTPSETLFDAPLRNGECASLSAALAAVLMSLGFEVKYRTAGTRAADPTFFEHIYVVAVVPGVGEVALDPSYSEPLGWEHPQAVVKRDWPI
jgi:hypothetical protein